LIAVVVILAFVLNLLVLQDRSATTLVAMAERSLVAGSTFELDSVRLVPVDASFEGLGPLIDEEEISEHEGWVMARSVPEGGLVGVEDLAAPESAIGLRSMSLPVPPEHATGGSLSPGDRVDVISVMDGAARYIATGLEVIAVSEAGSGSIGSVTAHHVTVAVESDQALRLAEAMEAGSMELVRSTGAAEVEGESVGS
jgi:Flp pilus assembly protein CpaB